MATSSGALMRANMVGGNAIFGALPVGAWFTLPKYPNIPYIKGRGGWYRSPKYPSAGNVRAARDMAVVIEMAA